MNNLTVGSVIHGFKDLLDSQELSVEMGVSNRWIYSHLLNYRSTVLSQKMLDNKISNISYQSLTLNLEEVKDHDYPCISGSNCILLRTVVPIPYYIHMESITTPINRSGRIQKLSEINSDNIVYKAKSRFPSEVSDTYYFLKNTGNGIYAYVWSDQGEYLKSVTVTAIYHQPELVQAITSCDGTLDPCFNYLKADFLIDPELLSSINDKAIASLIKPKSTFSDILNDNLTLSANNGSIK